MSSEALDKIIERSTLEVLALLAKEGTITLEKAAIVMGTSIEEFEKGMNDIT